MGHDSAAVRQRGQKGTTAVSSNNGNNAKKSGRHGQNEEQASSGLAGLLKFILVLIFLAVGGLAVFAFAVPDDNYPVPFSYPSLPSIQVNNHLAKAERLYDGLLLGPEHIEHYKGDMYTGLIDGRVVKISNKGQISTVARFDTGHHCDVHDDEEECDKKAPYTCPLGFKFHTDGFMYICDTYLGLHKVNVNTGEVKVLLPSSVLVGGRPLNFLNNIDIGSDGIIYLSDSSAYPKHTLFLDLLDGRPTGRLFRYDPVRNTTNILLDNLGFANGVQLSKNEDFVLVSETFRARIMKYNLKGKNAGKADVFAENLPLFPDNIRPSVSGGFWVAGPLTRYKEKKYNLFDFIGPRPWLRKILTLLPPEWLAGIWDTGSMLVELNPKGEIVRMLMDEEGTTIVKTTSVEDVKGVLYLGSYHEPYIGRLDARNL